MFKIAMSHFPNAGIAMFLVVLMIIGTPLVLCPESNKRSCSISLNTALTTDHCPSSQTDWNEREKKFNCISYQQNCTASNLFSYHWVPNAWRNACVEVCAIQTPIVGKKCPEFNFGGQMVQEYNEGECKSCPFLYISTEAYKYMECFEFENVASSTTDVNNNSGHLYSTLTTVVEIESACSGFECMPTPVRYSVALLLGCIMVAAIIFVVSKRYSSKLRQNVPDLELQGK
ncbi:uncharacterized protein LOC134241029 [Saccostrea cucullata]|uniref:uncharacterized protein LOC134241029 n=1 Tax=Saccostrea cuccullata TaxID=36930 RepID=UPI002ED192D7